MRTSATKTLPFDRREPGGTVSDLSGDTGRYVGIASDLDVASASVDVGRLEKTVSRCCAEAREV